jgi:hypothetical protein
MVPTREYKLDHGNIELMIFCYSFLNYKEVRMQKNNIKLSLVFVCMLIAACFINAMPVFANNLSTTTLLTAGIDGKGGDRDSHSTNPQSVSYDGTIIVFGSEANNLVPGHSGYYEDIFAYNKKTKQTELISKGINGEAANSYSWAPSVSADGRYVAYQTEATNIVPGVKAMCGTRPTCMNAIVYDRVTKQNTLVNVNSRGTRVGMSWRQAPIISADGNFVVFGSDSTISSDDINDDNDVLVRDLRHKTTVLASVDNTGRTAEDVWPDPTYTISGDGRYVAFSSSARFAGNDINDDSDIFLRDLQTNKTTLVSVNKDGHPLTESDASEPVLSSDGRFLAYASSASGVVDNDTNRQNDIFLCNLQTLKTTRVSVASDGTQANNSSYEPSISADGRYIIFYTYANNLVPADVNEAQDIVMHYRDYGITRRVNVGPGGRPSDDTAYHGSVSGDGKTVVFTSWASNLSPNPLREWIYNVYAFYNPAVEIPYYDNDDLIDIF